jgi:ribosomal protein S18 acetylase RimI-like enzyme
MSARTASIRLRTPRAADRARVAEMVAATGAFRPDELDVALEVFDDAVAQPGADYHALGAYDDDDRLVGFTCYGPTPCTVHTWDLYWIVVDPAAQRLGVGKSLMASTEQAISSGGGRLVVVETSSRDDYSATHAFYEALRYVRAAHIPEYYAAADDLIVFTKQLAPPKAETAPHG